MGPWCEALRHGCAGYTQTPRSLMRVAGDAGYGRIKPVAFLLAAAKRLDTSAQFTMFQKALT